MKPLRWGVIFGSLLLMGGGYITSIAATFENKAGEHAARVDQPQIRMLALVLLIAAIGLAFVPDREQQP